MAALPYMQLYVADYLADTAHLTTEEHGAYLLLLFSYWQTGKPLRADRIASIARVSNERWASVEQTLKEFFHVSKGTWTHFRVEADLAKVDSKSKKSSDAGKASAKAKAIAKQALINLNSTDVATDVEQTYQRNVNHTRSGDTDIDLDLDQDQEHLSSGDDDTVSTKEPRAKKPGQEKPPYEKILAMYNEICGPTMKRAIKMDPARTRNIDKCWKTEWEGSHVFKSGGFWKAYFTAALSEPHWNGANGWKADFEFITRPTTVTKIMEIMANE